jgi:hypothetical protein
MIQTRMLAILRTKLRTINMEYSVLRRSKGGKGNPQRMRELRLERQALMLLIAEERGAQRTTRIARVPVPDPPSPLRSA